MFPEKERRRSVRIFLPSNQVRIVCGPYMALIGKVIDISMGGVRFQCESPLEGGEFLEMEIVLPSGPRLRSECRIVHAERDPQHPARLMYGVEFITLNDNARAVLHDFVSTKLAEQMKAAQSTGSDTPSRGENQ